MEYLRYLGLRATATSGRLVALGRLRLGPRAALLDRITLSNEGRSGERAPSRRYGRVGGRRPVAVGSTRWNILCVCGSWTFPVAGHAANNSLATVRAAERDLAAQAKAAYRTMVAAW